MSIVFEQWCPKVIGYVDNPNHKKIDKKLIKICNSLQSKIKKVVIIGYQIKLIIP